MVNLVQGHNKYIYRLLKTERDNTVLDVPIGIFYSYAHKDETFKCVDCLRLYGGDGKLAITSWRDLV